jgi:hypothetical protein
MKNKITTAFVIILLISTPFISYGAEAYKPFNKNQYPSNDFTISQANFNHGDALIKIIEAKRISIKYEEVPHFCRMWLSVKKSNKTVYRKYFDDIEPVGFSYGLFIPKVQPPSPYFAVVKNGDYDGSLFLISKNGKVIKLMGGFYFITKNKRYLFSEYASDATGLAVFDLRKGLVVFSSMNLPAEMSHWYENKGEYYFTTEPDSYNDPEQIVAFFYDFKTNKITQKNIGRSEFAAGKPVIYDFDPREYQDCNTSQNMRLDGDRD